MNILPKKRWHVRTKENIARVRKDEAEAAEKERVRQQSIKLAESEARTALLRDRAKQNTSTNEDFIALNDNVSETISTKEHVNFFKDVEDGTAEYRKSNKEYEKEKKDEKEKYEKQIGYLTYLGQDTNEALGKRSWYEELPSYKKTKTNDTKDEGEVNLKQKTLEDPIVLMKKYTKLLESAEHEMNPTSVKPKAPNDDCINNLRIKNKEKHEKSKRQSTNKLREEKKSKKRKLKHSKSINSSDTQRKEKLKSRKHHKKSRSPSESSSSNEDKIDELFKKQKLEILRAERLNREKDERRRSNELLARLSGGNKHPEEINKGNQTSSSMGPIRQKYNSQFNPTLAKQNYI